MGRKALPTEVKRLKGTLRPCRTNPFEPKPTDAIRAPPTYMSAHASQFCPATMTKLPTAVSKTSDSTLLRLFCNALAMREKLQAMVDKYGAVESGKVSGALNALMKVEALLAKTGSELGLTPSSRQRSLRGTAIPLILTISRWTCSRPLMMMVK